MTVSKGILWWCLVLTGAELFLFGHLVWHYGDLATMVTDCTVSIILMGVMCCLIAWDRYQERVAQAQREREAVDKGKDDLTPPPTPPSVRSGFTLIEVMVVIAILLILAVVTIGLVGWVQGDMKRQQTERTIRHLEQALIDILESPSLDVGGEARLSKWYNPPFVQLAPNDLQRNDIQELREEAEASCTAHLYHDRLRLYMPQSSDEIAPGIGLQIKSPVITTIARQETPGVQSFYPKGLSNAEYLYCVIANLNPSALSGIQSRELGDVDSNGHPEFLDGWGRPIRFMRCAPALTDSRYQPNVLDGINIPVSPDNDKLEANLWPTRPAFDDNGKEDGVTWASPDHLTVNQWKTPGSRLVRNMRVAVNPSDAKKLDNPDHEPDPEKDPPRERWTFFSAREWRTYPLVVSAGPDGKFDLSFITPTVAPLSPNPKASPRKKASHPDGGGADPDDMRDWQPLFFIYTPFSVPAGIPVDTDNDGELNHYDNISNHNL